MEVTQAAKKVRGLAERGDDRRAIFRVQARALGLFFDEMINTFDPDALIVGGGAIETTPIFQAWFIDEIRDGMPPQRTEQADIPIHIMPNGDTAGSRGAAIEALGSARNAGLVEDEDATQGDSQTGRSGRKLASQQILASPNLKTPVLPSSL